MGTQFVDIYSYLHFAIGIVAHFWGISLRNLILGHVIYEILENTPWGMTVINRWLKFWPGGKPSADSLMNSLGDVIFAIIGWWSVSWLEGFNRD